MLKKDGKVYLESENEWQFTSVYLDEKGIKLYCFQKNVLKTMLENKNVRKEEKSDEK